MGVRGDGLPRVLATPTRSGIARPTPVPQIGVRVAAIAPATTQKPRFHLSRSDPDLQDIAECGTLQGDGKDNSITGGNLWKLRDLQGQGCHMCNVP